jgi:hypothetical protein
MKKNVSILLFFLILTACQQANITAVPTTTPIPVVVSTPTMTLMPTLTVVPTSELVPYYGMPQPVVAIVNGKTYESEIGTTMWAYFDSNGNQYIEVGDAFAIITPKKPIVTASKLLLTLELPIPINPTELWYAIFAVTNDEINSQDPKEDVYRWHPDYEQQPSLPLLAEQELTFSLDPGTYVLEVHVGWGGKPPHTELEADYGFLIEVQE